MKDQTTLPADLAGYQQLFDCRILEDDIMIPEGLGLKDGHYAWRSHSHYVNPSHCLNSNPLLGIVDKDGRAYSSGDSSCPFRVYRKMPCPKQADANERMAAYQGEVVTEWTDKKPKAKTNDEGKPPLAHLPWAALREVALVQAYGHSKYGDFYNYKKGMEISRNLSCAIRHITDYMAGKDLDDESKRHHLAHAACRVLFALQNIYDNTQIDDRYRKS